MRRDNEHVWHVKQFTGGRRWQHPLVSSCRAALHSFAALAMAVGADVVEVHQDWVATALVAWPEAKAKVVDVAGAESLHQSTPRERPRGPTVVGPFLPEKACLCCGTHVRSRCCPSGARLLH